MNEIETQNLFNQIQDKENRLDVKKFLNNNILAKFIKFKYSISPR